MDATRTIQRQEIEVHIRKWFQGPKREQRFPVKGRPSRLDKGDYLYIIWRGLIYGRFRVVSIERIPLNQSPVVGPAGKQFVTKGTHNIVVEAPGELACIAIKRRGHQSIRYDGVPEWD